MTSNLITLAEYARQAGTDRQVIWYRVDQGLLPSVNVGGVPFIDAAAYPPGDFEKKKEGRPKKIKKVRKKT